VQNARRGWEKTSEKSAIPKRRSQENHATKAEHAEKAEKAGKVEMAEKAKLLASPKEFSRNVLMRFQDGIRRHWSGSVVGVRFNQLGAVLSLFCLLDESPEGRLRNHGSRLEAALQRMSRMRPLRSPQLATGALLLAA